MLQKRIPIFFNPLQTLLFWFSSQVNPHSIEKDTMQSHNLFRLLEWKKVNVALCAELLLYSLPWALQGFSLSILCLLMVAGWIWMSRQRGPIGTKGLSGPWGNLPWSLPPS